MVADDDGKIEHPDKTVLDDLRAALRSGLARVYPQLGVKYRSSPDIATHTGGFNKNSKSAGMVPFGPTSVALPFIQALIYIYIY